METIHRWLDGKTDFQGQRLADRIMQESLTFGATLAFIVGYFTQNLYLCMILFAATTFLVTLITVPAWPFYNKFHVEWLPRTTLEDTTASESTPGEKGKTQVG